MIDRKIDRLAEEATNAYVEFQERCHGKGRFPNAYFRAYFNAVVCYFEATKDATMIHRNIADSVHGLREKLQIWSSRAPDWAIADADRLECMLFCGYDPYFNGDEPPGL